jgi:hypothetical protein
MCIMEVRPGQQAATIAQAMAHNLSTVDRDLDLFKELLTARNDQENLTLVLRAQDLTHRAYAIMLAQFGMELAAAEGDEAGHLHQHDHGGERSFVDVAHHDAGLARRFETR